MSSREVELRYYTASDQDVEVSEWIAGGPSPPPEHLLTLRAHQLEARQASDELRSLGILDTEEVKLLEHQVDAAHRALFEMGGKAILADEVGLGKTIEVGMILKEMDHRETTNSILILTPAQLAQQWQMEMRDKFGLRFISNYDDGFEGFRSHDRIISSVDTAKSPTAWDAVVGRKWDVVVLDEAHYVRNRDTERYELLDNLRYDYGFFLTATPVQNELSDLYNIVTLLRPGLFGTPETFQEDFVAGDGTLKNREELRERLQRVMVRNRRADTDIDFVNRRIHTRTFPPTPAERELYEAVTDFVKSAYRSGLGQKLVLMVLQKEVVSSPAALEKTIEKQLHQLPDDRDPRPYFRIMDRLEEVSTPTKLQKLDSIIENAREQVEKGRLIVFTQFRKTQDEIANRARKEGHAVHLFHGGMSSGEKEEAVEALRQDGGVLVSTDSMSEGRNLQFANLMVNYDLPWNPMRVEQRIGRIHRIGQEREVHIFNLALQDTIEEYVLEKLYDKIALFSQTVGELSTILSRLEESGRDFEHEVFEKLVNADSEVELENNFDEMAVDLSEQKELAEKMSEFNDKVFESFDLGA